MTKKLKAVLVPMNKRGMDIDDIIQSPIDYKISFADYSIIPTDDTTLHFLLLDIHAHIKKDNYVVYKELGKPKPYELYNLTSPSLVEGYNQMRRQYAAGSDVFVASVYASYPHLENTIPISKQNVQEWINRGLPKGRIPNTLYDVEVDLKDSTSYTWFIEDLDTHKWYTGYIKKPHGNTFAGTSFGEFPTYYNYWSNNPNKAKKYSSQTEANDFIYLLGGKIHNQINIQPTEHEFISTTEPLLTNGYITFKWDDKISNEVQETNKDDDVKYIPKTEETDKLWNEEDVETAIIAYVNYMRKVITPDMSDIKKWFSEYKKSLII